MSLIKNILGISKGASSTQWIIELILNNWGNIALALSTTGIFAFAVWSTDWLISYGPAVWMGCIIATTLFILFSFGIIGLVRAKTLALKARAELDLALSRETTKINPLRNSFESETIDAIDLFIPYQQKLISKHFKDCHLRGPGIFIFMSNLTMIEPKMSDCTLICVPEKGFMVHGVIGLESCSFIHCHFFMITFLVPRHVAVNLKVQNPQMRIIGLD